MRQETWNTAGEPGRWPDRRCCGSTRVASVKAAEPPEDTTWEPVDLGDEPGFAIMDLITGRVKL
jgi:hypothetical protein